MESKRAISNALGMLCQECEHRLTDHDFGVINDSLGVKCDNCPNGFCEDNN